MQIYEELVARGLIAQVTDEEEIKELGYRSLVNAYYYYKKTNLL